MKNIFLAFALVATACVPALEAPTGTAGYDDDGDGWAENGGKSGESTGDCDDADPDIYPGADELCDGVDNDCDGVADNDPIDGVVWFVDSDGDGEGDPAATTVTACAGDQPTDHVDNDLDCDDSDATLNSGTVWYEDGDGDGYGATDIAATQCEQPPDSTDNSDDCDDGNASVNPGAQEVCDPMDVDEDCANGADDADPSAQGQTDWYLDDDGDGFGDPYSLQSACDAPSSYVADNTDCDDTNVAVNPQGIEVCDLLDVDEDCDGAADDDDLDSPPTYLNTFFLDMDGDSFGDPNVPIDACDAPTNYVEDNTDCDDTSIDINPNTSWYDDVDGDGFGDPNAETVQCANPGGHVTNPDDCNDGDILINPNTIWYADADGDGFGDLLDPTQACTQPTGYVADNQDCDDDPITGPDLNPDTEWWPDVDGDGYGDLLAVATVICDQPSGFVRDDTDCDDNDPGLNPNTQWWPDADSDGYGDPNGVIASQCTAPVGHVDNAADCDDDPITGPSIGPPPTWFADADGDGYGNPLDTLLSCTQPTGYVADDQDCDDDPVTGPGLNPDTEWWPDVDGDGYGDELTLPSMACEQPSGTVGNGTDCDDNDIAINDDTQWWPDADADGFGDPSGLIVVQCEAPLGHASNGDDCDDDPVTGPLIGAIVTWYIDGDGDGYGDDNDAGVDQCTSPGTGYVDQNGDCADGDPAINPGEFETCDTVDTNCSGDESDAIDANTYYADTDLDTYGDPNAAVTDCTQPIGTVTNDMDCDDTNILVHPAAIEVCNNGLDDDCDGTFNNCGLSGVGDDGDVADLTIWQKTPGADTWCDSGQVAIGDLDGDSVPDMVVGDVHAYQPGRLALFLGPLGPAASPLVFGTDSDEVVTEVDEADFLGWSLAAGRLNGDNSDDLAFEYIDAAGGVGRVEIHMGTQPYVPFTIGVPEATINFAAPNERGGRDVVIGDVNGDPLHELLVGDHYDNGQVGAVYLFEGIPTGTMDLDTDYTTRFDGDPAGYYLGGSYHAADPMRPGPRTALADLDGDGQKEIAMATINSNRGGFTGQGAVHVAEGFMPGIVDLATDSLRVVNGNAENSRFGVSVAAGDLDNDGYDEFVVGGRGGLEGVWILDSSLLLAGGADLDADAAAWASFEGTTHELGIGVAVGDPDGDGDMDLLMMGTPDDGEWGGMYLVYDPGPGVNLVNTSGSYGAYWRFPFVPNAGSRYPGTRGPLITDVDGNGVDDIVVPSRGSCDKGTLAEPDSSPYSGVFVHFGGGF